MRKIKVLEINNIDLIGKRFNGYDLIEYFENSKIEVNQIVVLKKSKNNKVITFFDESLHNLFFNLAEYENRKLSTHSCVSIIDNYLFNNEYYKNCDIVHLHMLHNTRLSLFSLLEIYKDKKIIISLHDPWFMTGRCVHPFECQEWRNGCLKCNYLDTLFPFKNDNAASLWKLKKEVFENIDCELIVSSKYMLDMVKASPILSKQKVNFIPFGVDLNLFKPLKSNSGSRKKYNISEDSIVLFFRAQFEFKGLEFIIEALKKLDIEKEITLLTCDTPGLLTELEGKYKIIECGVVEGNQMIELYQICDIFLMPSKGESFGMMAVEAMACGKPVIIFDNSSLPSVTFAPECGFVVENMNSEKLKKGIQYLIENPEERKLRGNLGRQLAEQHYNIDDYNKKIEKLYIKVYHDKRRKKINNFTEENYVIDYNSINFLKSELKKLLNVMQISIYPDFMFLKQKKRYNKKIKIDYSNFYVQQLLKKFNEALYLYTIGHKKLHYFEKRNKIKTAYFLFLYDRKRFFNVLINKLKRK